MIFFSSNLVQLDLDLDLDPDLDLDLDLDPDLDPDPDPHSEKLRDPDPHKMNADPQPCLEISVMHLGPLVQIGLIFPESGSGSAKKSDLGPKNPDP